MFLIAISLVPWNLISCSHKTHVWEKQASQKNKNGSYDYNWRNSLLLKNRRIHFIFQINKPKVNSRICARCLDNIFTLDYPTQRWQCEIANSTESQAGSACGVIVFLLTQEDPSLPPPCWDCRQTILPTRSYAGAGDPNSSPHAGTRTTLPIEPPSPSLIILVLRSLKPNSGIKTHRFNVKILVCTHRKYLFF